MQTIDETRELSPNAETSARPALSSPGMQSRMLMVTLAVIDILFIVANVLHWRIGDGDPVFSNPAWDGDIDQSFIESFGYILIVSAIVGLTFLAVRRRSFVLGVWILIQLALVSDDLFMIHERGGELFVGLGLGGGFGLRAQDVGELAVWGAMIVPLGILLLIAHFTASAQDRRDSLTLFLLTGVLAMFAVVLDAVSHPLSAVLPSQVGTGLTLLETAGELVAMSLIAVAVHRMTLGLTLRGDRTVE
ncbi:hypothetical protein QMG83_03985 [Salinibacterium sp. G-O1]|uniref:hypothetical protein n=1 Tax=Salinibacterium sp. G-O1 TaxID=3046208 RepID=UPI0024BAF9C8|nr:hypothetical protein [Salinibacterium sp. G-O1]MDJ0334376.1 hypothetical protein [Salinibacterium sp. G-O1]